MLSATHPVITKVAYSLRNLDIHDSNTHKLQKWVQEQYKDLTPKTGVTKEQALATLKETELRCEEMFKLTQDGRKELESILDAKGYNGRAVIALAEVAKEFLY